MSVRSVLVCFRVVAVPMMFSGLAMCLGDLFVMQRGFVMCGLGHCNLSRVRRFGAYGTIRQ